MVFSDPAVPPAASLPGVATSVLRDVAVDDRHGHASASELLGLLDESVIVKKSLVRAGDTIYSAGESFSELYVLNSGFCKIVSPTRDCREQVVGLKFRGDWLGFDGIAHGRFTCGAVAMDTGDVWAIHYDKLLAACVRQPALLPMLHQAMSRELSGRRDSLMSVCTLPAAARVADFLRYWVGALSERGMRSDQITLRMTRAEIGNYLGLTLETVSRALSQLARDDIIAFTGKGRREVRIPDVRALSVFVQGCLATAAPIH